MPKTCLTIRFQENYYVNNCNKTFTFESVTQFIDYFLPKKYTYKVVDNSVTVADICIVSIKPLEGSDYTVKKFNDNEINILVSTENNNYWPWVKVENDYVDHIPIYFYNHIPDLLNTPNYLAIPTAYAYINYLNKYQSNKYNTSFSDKKGVLIINKSGLNREINIIAKIIQENGISVDHISLYTNEISSVSCYHSHELLSVFNRYKFIICVENSYTSGYMTEKIINCFLANTIPLYKGATNIATYINPDSFVDIRDPDWTDKLIELNNNEELYNQMLNSQKISPTYDNGNYMEKLEKRLASELEKRQKKIKPENIPDQFDSEFISGYEFYKLSRYSYCNRYPVKPIDSDMKDDDLVFINLDLFDQFLSILRENVPKVKFNLITHNSDSTFTENHYKLISPFVNKVYSINTSFSHENVIKIPLGFVDTRYKPHTNFKNIKNNDTEKLILAYMNFSINTNRTARQPCWDNFKDVKWVLKESDMPPVDFYKSIQKSKYVISPVGTGIDCHRIYESIYFNTVPILVTTSMDDFYRKLPVVIYDKWEDVTEEDLVEKYDNNFKRLLQWKENNPNWLDASFWIENKIVTGLVENVEPKKLICFSIWGKEEIYNIGAYENAILAKTVYPGWICRIYYSDMDENVRKLLSELDNVEMVMMDEKPDLCGAFWRFLPAFTEKDIIYISRDTDSRLNMREKHAVDEWLESGKDFHIMRDHVGHRYPVMAGMWGSRNNILLDMKTEYSKNKNKGYYTGDQDFLKLVYDRVKDNVIVHDSHNMYKNETDVRQFKNCIEYDSFVGSYCWCAPNYFEVTKIPNRILESQTRKFTECPDEWCYKYDNYTIHSQHLREIDFQRPVTDCFIDSKSLAGSTGFGAKIVSLLKYIQYCVVILKSNDIYIDVPELDDIFEFPRNRDRQKGGIDMYEHFMSHHNDNWKLGTNAHMICDRKKINNYTILFNHYISLKNKDTFDNLYNKYITNNTLGVHLRGTDKWTEIKPVNDSVILQKIDKIVKDEKLDKIFLATDSLHYRNLLVSNFGDMVCFNNDIIVSSNNEPIHLHNKHDKYLINRQALYECQILSRCKNFLYCFSNISYLSLMMGNEHFDRLYCLNSD